MLFSDGICNIYQIKNAAASGDKPKEKLVLSSSHWYGELKVGITRYYQALKADSRVDMLIEIWRDDTVDCSCICILQDSKQYRIKQVQPTTNSEGLKVTDLSLERLGDCYDIATT